MFIGREAELAQLEKLYSSPKFEFLIIYGRRRIGKTTILKEFSKRHKVLFFSAEEKNSALNLSDFGEQVLSYFGGTNGLQFQTWKSAFEYISAHTANEKTVIIIDEFPFIAKEDQSIKSVLQHIIDHKWQEQNIMLVLCGSSVSFMINDVMGYQSPLYGRKTSVMEITPFDYTITAQYFPHYTPIERLKVYGILGGVPYYLQQFSDTISLAENISNTIVSSHANLRDEPLTLLRAELREPMVYNSILEAIATGATKPSEIASKIGDTVSKCSAYLSNLREMRLIDRITPCGEKQSGKISIYRLTDNFFAFWYKFLFSQKTKLELMEPMAFSTLIVENLSDYMGLAFEKICLQYLVRQARCGNLPFIPSALGKWWGNDPALKKQDDIDVLGIDGNQGIFCECKFKDEPFSLSDFNDLIAASNIFTNITDRFYYIFVKSGYTQAVKEESKNYQVKLLTVNDLFD
jgi:hypothetical protein